MLRVLLRTNALDDRVRKTLVDTLYMQPANLAIGAITGVLCSLVAASYSPDQIFLEVAVLLSAVAVARIAMAVMLPRLRNRDARRMELLYELGAFTYSAVLGVFGAMTVWYQLPATAQLLMVGYAIGYGTGIAARNAGRPTISIVQMLLIFTPINLALWSGGELAQQALAVAIVLLWVGMISITLKVFHTLRDSVAAADTSARLAEKMQHLARTDVVTGLHNRAGLNHYLVEYMSRRRALPSLALFWLDLDKFKDINDALGHQVGDRVLSEVGQRLRAQAKPDAVIGRFGGDEFIVACDVRDRREAETIALAVLAEVTRPIRIDDDRLEIGCSMGIALQPDDGEDLETLFQGADLALYHAKVNGRNQVSFYDPSMSRNLVRRREIEAELRLALQRDELSIFFQPIIELATGRIRAFEALVRWFHPIKGELRPDEFIPVAEETGAIITLGNWITTQAARAAAQWPDDVTVAVNLSPLQIKAPGAALGILNALREARLPPHRLELEITETVLLDHSKQTEDFMAELSAAGVRFALDDFGTGYSSLGYLNKYPFGKIKVDRSFVSGVNVGKKSDAIIRAVSGMASTLDMQIVAEGLETIEQVQAVQAAGCTLGQGYYFSRAVPDYLAGMLLAREREQLDGPQRAAG
ncbi:bifunctional diguanylate cyclase/phosphodiesterase [Novosphingobium sp.]|uniref:putative bifunctional diguanylate cyclase/phosphodiesterase n=1 Tax=Novosphingobium sp. TaxID=1874826 RepID=UPI0027360844|nr:EAL domain-containing protein [Novosphingobium sp.]MDP3907439.1 EAL domain-containing protein [Novosphingobium sp.]